jgi:hypothetical protein
VKRAQGHVSPEISTFESALKYLCLYTHLIKLKTMGVRKNPEEFLLEAAHVDLCRRAVKEASVGRSEKK